ncbi:MAG: bifunctional 5,10-methylenetetrahydrofolate dehydrogenase/5,10-methenyltetrahydrofolate cyclohydrolase [Patescibacteria group bacterium]|nr:bifunctional 5,10-methylenetetrahydrofolate dehydrogenase/5,10-methenyltetrahydrofolate cyclohydrolase [Patescibacteria group bacterium]MCL5224340.1 bifunctional 5,10-methylenetetrahydrofolate dehydrogenase/5,10-methenyltetrahydrofolate cyclohydrolase [Patescibacteria group bacterium]
MQEIPGKKIAQELIAQLKKLPPPGKILAAVLVGDDTDSQNFLREKEKVGRQLGVRFKRYNLSGDWSQDKLRHEVGHIALQNSVGGLLVQLPLPNKANPYYVLNAVPREKDVDVLGERALGAYYAGRNLVLPPAVATIEEVLKAVDFNLAGKSVAVVGPGLLIGKPASLWLLGKVGNLSVVDTGGDYSPLQAADLVICGSGAAGTVKPAMLKDGAGLIDFGYGRNTAGKLIGDFASDQLTDEDRKRLAFYTPTPGGTGPILIAELFNNFFKLTARATQ